MSNIKNELSTATSMPSAYNPILYKGNDLSCNEIINFPN